MNAVHLMFLLTIAFAACFHATSAHMMMRGGHDEGMMMGEDMMEHKGNCPFAIQIDGKDIQEGECVASPPEGLVTKIEWKDHDNSQAALSRLVVWDTQAPCELPGEVYIHLAGQENGILSTPLGTNDIHTYRAALFDQMPVPVGATGCHSMPDNMPCHHVKTWKMARHACPDSDE